MYNHIKAKPSTVDHLLSIVNFPLSANHCPSIICPPSIAHRPSSIIQCTSSNVHRPPSIVTMVLLYTGLGTWHSSHIMILEIYHCLQFKRSRLGILIECAQLKNKSYFALSHWSFAYFIHDAIKRCQLFFISTSPVLLLLLDISLLSNKSTGQIFIDLISDEETTKIANVRKHV